MYPRSFFLLTFAAVALACSSTPDESSGPTSGSGGSSGTPASSSGTPTSGVSSSTGDDFGLQSGTATSVGAQVRLPVYQGGLPSARIRQAQAIEGQTLEQVIGTERAVVAATRSAFADYKAAMDSIAANQVAVSANELALAGVRAENTVGTRSILDVLDAEQELLNSQVLLVTARRDAYVAGFQLLNAMGQAEAQDLGLDGGPLYDPLGNYRRVAGDWSDWAMERRHNPVATRTVSPQELPAEPLVTAPLVPAPVDAQPVVTPGVTPPRQ